jgi:hypothetical protein
MLFKFLLFLSIIGTVQAQSVGGCAPKEGEKCGVCDTDDIDAFEKLTSNPVNKDGETLSNVADFLQELPDSLKESFLFMSDSRSFQRSDFENPRVLMKSENSDIILSFNGHKDIGGEEFLGEDRIEAMVWNGKEAKFDFIDIQFPEEGPSGRVGAKPKITKNDAKCLNCHGGKDPRPNWDPYNFWQGQMPFNRDTLAPGTMESEYYIELIKQTEGKGQIKNKRMEALKSSLNSKQITSALKDGPLRLRDFSSSDGPGVRMFDQLTPRNFCRIGNRLKERNDVQAIAPALQGAMKGCDNFTDFFPEEAKELNKRFFERRKLGTDDGKFNYQTLNDQTSSLQQGVKNDKEERHLWSIQKDILRRAKIDGKEITDEEALKVAREEMDAIVKKGHGRLENRESRSNAQKIAAFRYLLEPLGESVDSWSMSIDPGSYSFADLLSNLRRYLPEIEGVNGSMSCDDLAKESKKRLEASKPYQDNLTSSSCNDDFLNIPLDDKLSGSSKVALEVLRGKAQDILNKNACVACHVFANKANGAPELPFNDLKKLEKMISSTKESKNGGWSQQIWNRINKPEGSKGQMPLGMPPITDEEKQIIKSYFNAIEMQGK